MRRVLITLLFLCVSLIFFSPKVESYALDEYEEELVFMANEALAELIEYEDIMSSVYLCTSYDVKAEASEQSDTICTIYGGQLVFVEGVAMDEDHNIWNKVYFYYDAKEYTGYILRENLVTSNTRFLEWENEYAMNPDYWNGSMQSMLMTLNEGEESNADIATIEEGESQETVIPEDIRMFPESYWQYLISLKEKHPNWSFVMVKTNLDFQDVINNELGDKSLVGGQFKSYREMIYGQNWYYANDEILKFYIDPRNSLTEDRIFQFEQLTFNPEAHREEDLSMFLEGTFMSSSNVVPGTSLTYAHLIYTLCCEPTEDGGIKRTLSPYHMASRIIQEQSVKGSVLVAGNIPGYEGLYNYFNIRATGRTDEEVIRNGLEYARTQHWDDGYWEAQNLGKLGAYKALEGGADFLYNGYIKNGQDTLYYQKFNVVPGLKPYSHQYMQNIMAPTTESQTTQKLYKTNEEQYNAMPFVFKIPVYENMPETACERPLETTKFYISLPEGYAENGVSKTPDVWIDGVKHQSISRNGYLVVDAGNKEAKTAIIYKYGGDGFESGMYVWFLDYENGTYGSYKAALVPELEDLLSYWGFSIRIVEPSGIRFTSGIRTEIKNKLINDGISGYHLKEYGTLVTLASRLDDNGNLLPFVKGGENVVFGVSYGQTESGMVDEVTEQTEDVTEFSAVFVGVPVEMYRIVFNFRCYAELEQDGDVRTLYGPNYGKSIYSLADRIINAGIYTPESLNYEFIKKIIDDSNAHEQSQE